MAAELESRSSIGRIVRLRAAVVYNRLKPYNARERSYVYMVCDRCAEAVKSPEFVSTTELLKSFSRRLFFLILGSC